MPKTKVYPLDYRGGRLGSVFVLHGHGLCCYRSRGNQQQTSPCE